MIAFGAPGGRVIDTALGTLSLPVVAGGGEALVVRAATDRPCGVR